MMKELLTRKMIIPLVICFALCLAGCKPNSDVNEANFDDVTAPAQAAPTSAMPPTQTTPTGGETQSPVFAPPAQTTTQPQTAPPDNETQTPGSTFMNQTDPSEPAPATAEKVKLSDISDGTEVKITVSGGVVESEAVIIGGEVLAYDANYIFGNLKDAGGKESAGFIVIGMTAVDSSSMKYAIYNSIYSITIEEGEYSFSCNDETIPLTIPAQTINGHFSVPLVAIAKAIGATVEWDEAVQTISFFY